MSSPLPDRSPISAYALNLEDLQALPAGTPLTFFYATNTPQLHPVTFLRVDNTRVYYLNALGYEASRYLTDAGIAPGYGKWHRGNCVVLPDHCDQPFQPQTARRLAGFGSNSDVPKLSDFFDSTDEAKNDEADKE